MLKDSMFGTRAPDVERWSSRVVVVRGLNPGPFTGPGTNTYLVGTGPRPILIDTGIGHAGYVPLLEKTLASEFRSDAPEGVLMTHAHRDHLGGLDGVLEKFGAIPAGKLGWAGKDALSSARLDAIEPDDEIHTDGATLRALHCPGHAPDHLCFYLEEERALFTGDVVLGAGTTVIPLEGGDMRLYMESLRRILGLDLERIYPGHGPRIDAPKARVRAYLEHRLERERQILAALRDGAQTVSSVVSNVYADTPSALHPAAAQSVMSHLLKLEVERRVQYRLDAAGERIWMVLRERSA